MIRRLLAALVATAPVLMPASVAANTPPAPMVTAVEVITPHQLIGPPPEQFLADLPGLPLSRARVRQSLDRLWALGIFESVEVEMVSEPGGVRLRYRVSRRPHLESLDWTGKLGLAAADLAAAAALALGGPADPPRLERARTDVLARLRREGYLGADARLDIRENPATNGRAVTFVVNAGKEAYVGRVEITGLARAEEKPLRKALGLSEGDVFRERAYRDGLRAVDEELHAQGFFESRVTPQQSPWDPTVGHVDLTLQVVEGPLTLVKFVGRQALEDKRLRERLTFAEAPVVDEVEVRASAEQIERAYREEGFHFVSATGELDGDATTRIVTFEIDEGPRVTVESITFEGTAAVPASRLSEQMQTRPAGLIPFGPFRGLFVEEQLTRDVQALRQFLRTQGFASAEVGPAGTTFGDDRTRAQIVIPVVEGPRQSVAGVVVIGNKVVPSDRIHQAIGFHAGDPWDGVRAEEARRRIEQLYQRRGYRGTKVSLTTAETFGGVQATYAVQEGELTRVGQILISGLTVTRPDIVRRELPFKPGDPLTAVDLAEARRRLDTTRLFDRVDVEPQGDVNAPFRDVAVTLREAKPWRVEFGAGYATDEGFRGFVTLGHDNLFGTGRSIALRERVSQKGDRTELEYREPWMFGTEFQGEAIAFRERKEEIGYVSERMGTTFTAQRELLSQLFRPEEPTDHPPMLRGGLRYRLERFQRSDIDPDLLADGAIQARDDLVTSLMPFLSLELRDQPTDPRHGSFHYVSFEVGSSALGGEVDFVKFQLEDSLFFSWPPSTVLALSSRIGLAAPYGRSDALVIEDRFKAGGSTTIRGYKLDKVGPLDASGNPIGGNLRILLNFEWRFPIYRWLGGVTFFDVGAVTPEVTDFSFSDFYPGVGGGLRITTPIGPIRLDVGYGLRPIRNDDRVQVYLTIGQAF
jgi:outer membrane protein insertion porin family